MCLEGCKMGLFFGSFLMAVGIILLGNELSWWNLNVPLIPLAVIFWGLSMVVDEVKKRK